MATVLFGKLGFDNGAELLSPQTDVTDELRELVNADETLLPPA